MNIRIVYDQLGMKKGYTTLTNKRAELLQRLNRLGIPIESIERLVIDGKDYEPRKLKG